MRKKRTYTDLQKIEYIEKFHYLHNDPDVKISRAKFCKENGLSPKTFTDWLKKFSLGEITRQEELTQQNEGVITIRENVEMLKDQVHANAAVQNIAYMAEIDKSLRIAFPRLNDLIRQSTDLRDVAGAMKILMDAYNQITKKEEAATVNNVNGTLNQMVSQFNQLKD